MEKRVTIPASHKTGIITSIIRYILYQHTSVTGRKLSFLPNLAYPHTSFPPYIVPSPFIKVDQCPPSFNIYTLDLS